MFSSLPNARARTPKAKYLLKAMVLESLCSVRASCWYLGGHERKRKGEPEKKKKKGLARLFEGGSSDDDSDARLSIFPWRARILFLSIPLSVLFAGSTAPSAPRGRCLLHALQPTWASEAEKERTERKREKEREKEKDRESEGSAAKLPLSLGVPGPNLAARVELLRGTFCP